MLADPESTFESHQVTIPLLEALHCYTVQFRQEPENHHPWANSDPLLVFTNKALLELWDIAVS